MTYSSDGRQIVSQLLRDIDLHKSTFRPARVYIVIVSCRRLVSFGQIYKYTCYLNLLFSTASEKHCCCYSGLTLLDQLFICRLKCRVRCVFFSLKRLYSNIVIYFMNFKFSSLSTMVPACLCIGLSFKLIVHSEL